MTPPRNDVAALNSARRAAALYRAEWLMSITDGIVTLQELMTEASRPEARALLKLSLRQVLLSQPGWGRKKAEKILMHIESVTGATMERRKITVGWLLDPRAGGRRYAAWLDAFEPKTTPWPGFPYARSTHV